MAALPNYSLRFSDEFDQLSIAHTGTATANWYSGQAWGGGFGDARLMKANAPGSPFSIVEKGGESALAITMSRNASGQLESGLISSMFPDGTSRMPQDGNFHGYYETRLWLPEGQGVWPAFWAIEKERLSANRDHVFEVDVMEQHGNALADRFSSAVHDWNWNGTKLEGHTGSSMQNVVGKEVMTTGWHTYGVEVRPDLMTFYLDGEAYYATPTPTHLDTDPIFMINLAAGGGWPVSATLDDIKLYVDYFRAYETTDGTPPKPAPPTLTGKAGDDTFQVKTSDTRITEAADGGYDTVRSSVDYTLGQNVEKLLLLDGKATKASGNELGNQLFGNSNDNVLKGFAGDDALYGRDGNDQIFGGIGDDKLYGEKGDDVLIGGSGADRLEGGLGADTFVFLNVSDSLPASFDRIIDFSRAQGDRIDLSAIDANSLVAGDQAFSWIGSQAFTAAGQLRLQKGVLYADVNGDHVADVAVQVGTVGISSADFIL